jgi:hypothetical protein
MRRRPYTKRGIRRVKCSRVGCSNKAVHTFNICAVDRGIYYPVCVECDIKINEIVVRLIFGDKREDELRRYREAAL